MKSHCLQLSVLFLILVSLAMASETWYVDGVNGNDNNSCDSPTTACKTIDRAMSRAFAGDSIMVAPATYSGTIIITTSVSIVGAGPGKTIISGSNNQTYNAVIVIPNQSPHLIVSLSEMTITGGGRGSYGGGILNSGALTINKVTVSGNSATDGGAGITCGTNNFPSTAVMNINNSTISGNSVVTSSSSGRGGGIYTFACPTTINNSTISGNSATQNQGGAGGAGGGIASFSSLTINNSTISGNSATEGGGIVILGNSTTTIQNSIVANNLATASSSANCSAPAPAMLISHGYNLSSDGSCNFSSVGDLNNTDPKLGPLQNNGGPTQTMALLPGSPAIDSGNPSGCTDGHGHLLRTDQRGMRRPDREDSGGCDRGAYEKQSD